jgi:phosphoglycerate dehydrogenase-like enzyme
VRPTVVVLGSAEDPPPQLDVAERLATVRFASTEEGLREVLAQSLATVVFAWDYEPSLLPSVWDSAGELRWIQTASAGVDRLLFPELIESDVVVTNARGVFEEPMAEYVLGLIIAFTKDFPTTVRETQAKRWNHRDTERVAGKRLMVVGPGPIGRAAGGAAKALGMEVEAVGRTSRPAEEPFSRIYGRTELLEALPGADYVLDAAPLTEETRHMFDERAFRAMKPSARFLNVGRGATVDTDAVVAALYEGGIAGAALDVFEEEPLPGDHPLWDAPNVIVSPHMSGDIAGWEIAVADVFLDNLQRFVEGRPLRNIVDKERGHGA